MTLRSDWRPVPPPLGWRDRALVGVLAAAAVVEGLVRTDLADRPWSVAVSVVLVATLLPRRSHPLVAVGVAFGVGAAAAVVAGRQFPEQAVIVCQLLLPYSLVRWAPPRHVAIGSTIMSAALAVSWALGHTGPGDALGGAAVLGLALATGAAVRYRARARAREREQITMLERERLARDLHDTVAHHVTAMAIRAQAGIALAPTDPTAAVEALHLIDTEAARALDDMRAIVRLLRTPASTTPPASPTPPTPAGPDLATHGLPTEDTAPNPGLRDLHALASDVPPPVAVTVDGDVDGLPSPLAATVYRIAQEAVTNARRHARRATRVDVHLAATPTEVRLRVSDDGERRHAAAAGFGIIGMAERAALLGGSCTAGPDADRGWSVAAVLPVSPPR